MAKSTALPSDRPLYCHVKSMKQVRNNHVVIMAGFCVCTLLDVQMKQSVSIAEQTGHVLAWKHGIAVLTAGDVKVTSNPRIRLMPPQGMIDASARSHSNSYNLEIQNVRITDAGEYACQIGSIVPKEIVHSLEVLGEYYPLSNSIFHHRFMPCSTCSLMSI